ncbi:E3 ubiquitin-protein ligase ATL4 [Pyrus x bretschneideri]|uniref:E3 ubiquitin-protein ligase ATL4 n=1 Tax=Pyrus x bretschneideri TaxID=225117 RepID=UPI00202EB0F3|nr:E3 ubiquitin-protein ligase ATL4 [Pyrus x bretschneideri]
MSETVAAPPPPLPILPHRQSSSSSFKTLTPSLFIIIVILTATLVASICLCLILRHFNRRCIRRLAPSPAVSSSDSRRISTRRVNPVTLPALPLFTFSSITRRSSTTISADCAVCLSKFEPSDELRLLPLCCHAFHAVCIDTWLQSQQTCPLCRSSIAASDAELMTLASSNDGAATTNGGSFRLEIGNVSRRNNNQTTTTTTASSNRHSYSVGSFDYIVDEEASEVEVRLSNAEREKDEVILPVTEPEPPIQPPFLAAEVGSGRSSWLKDYIDRLSSTLSSRDISFRSSGRFFTGSSRRSEVSVAGDWSLETERVGEEISEMFRWLAGV